MSGFPPMADLLADAARAMESEPGHDATLEAADFFLMARADDSLRAELLTEFAMFLKNSASMNAASAEIIVATVALVSMHRRSSDSIAADSSWALNTEKAESSSTLPIASCIPFLRISCTAFTHSREGDLMVSIPSVTSLR